MLVVKASAKPSKLQGLGLFADEKIPKGTIIWRYNPRFDIFFDPEEVKKMPKEQKDLVLKYAFLSTVFGKYVYSIDDSRFTNHSEKNANEDSVVLPGEKERVGRANRDIQKGEEILVNYRDFDEHDKTSTEAYLEN